MYAHWLAVALSIAVSWNIIVRYSVNDSLNDFHGLQQNCNASLCVYQKTIPYKLDQVGVNETITTPTRRDRLLLEIGQYHLFHSSNVSVAESFLRESADLGNVEAQFLMGSLIATKQLTSGEITDAILMYHFSALGGSMAGSMAMGYRQLYGYNTAISCDSALRHYKAVADHVISQHPEIPIQFYSNVKTVRLRDNQNRRPHRLEDEYQRAEFLRQRAQTSRDSVLLTTIANLILFSDLYRDPSNSMAHREARRFLERAVLLGDAKANAYLGHVYAYGLGGLTSPQVETAVEYYTFALNKTNGSDSAAHIARGEAANGLGLLHLHGKGGLPKDVERAMSYFQSAVRFGHPDGIYNSALLMINTHPQQALEYLKATAAIGHVKASFTLARWKEKHQFHGTGLDNSCSSIVALYKQVAENALVGRTILRQAINAYLDGDWVKARLFYGIAAEMGYEVAEQNAAWLTEHLNLDQRTLQTDTRYLQLVQRGVRQKSPDAMIRRGDLAYQAKTHNYKEAVMYYEQALARAPRHPRALYSLGFMYEYGLGVERNLTKALDFYRRTGQRERSMEKVMLLLQWKIRAVRMVERAYDIQWKAWAVRMAEQAYEIQWKAWAVRMVERAYEFVSRGSTASTITASESASNIQGKSSSDPARVHFVAAMEFTGQSHMQLELAQEQWPIQGITDSSFTLETWLWIKDHSKLKSQVLLDHQHGFRLELCRASDGATQDTRWFLCVTRTNGLQTKLLLAPFQSQVWYHIALVMDSKQQNLTLYVDGIDRQQVHFPSNRRDATSSNPSKVSNVLIRLGNRLNPTHSMGFSGQLMHFHVWAKALTQGEIQNQRTSSPVDSNPVEGMVVALDFDLDRRDSKGKWKRNQLKPVPQMRNIAAKLTRFPPTKSEMDS